MKKLIALAAFVGLSVWLVGFLHDAGQFKDINPHFAGQCDIIPGVVGAEDISFVPGSSIALVSGYDRRITQQGQDVNGGIFAYNLENKKFTKISPPLADFRPHGISLYQMPNGQPRVFVINHSQGGHAVNIFDLIDDKLELFKTIKGPGLISPNDLVAVGPEQFYVSNDHKYLAGVMRLLEDYLSLKLSSVVYFDGQDSKNILSGIGYANGINVSTDGKTVYLSALTQGLVNIYARQSNNELSLMQSIDSGTGVDNIELDENGDLWIGAHPKLLAFVGHAKDREKLAPSQVLKVSVSDGVYKVQEVLLDSGALLSASSVGAVKGNRLLVGAVFDEKILDCVLPMQLTAF